MKNWYLATYKKTDGTYGTALVLSDNEAKAGEHFKDHGSSSVRIAAEDIIALWLQLQSKKLCISQNIQDDYLKI